MMTQWVDGVALTSSGSALQPEAHRTELPTELAYGEGLRDTRALEKLNNMSSEQGDMKNQQGRQLNR